MLQDETLKKLFKETFEGCKSYKEEFQRLKNIKGKYAEPIQDMYCNELLYLISQGYTKYNDDSFEKDEAVQIYLKSVELLPREYTYYYLLYYFFKKENNKVLSVLGEYLKTLYENSKEDIDQGGHFINEYSFIDLFFEPFKQAFPSFWTSLAEILQKYPTQPGIPELCKVIDAYYNCKTDEDALELLLNMMQKYPEFVLIKELIGYTYYSMKMWNNAIAYLEATDETGLFFTPSNANFMMAWSYGKLKNRKLEEFYYRKALETESDNIIILNNFGYSLYLQKKYAEAKKVFEDCLAINDSYLYAANNYIRVLIALGRNKDAKDFIKSSKCKVSKELQNKVNKLDDKNSRIINKISVDAPSADEDTFSLENAVDLCLKRQQFSSEKLLEDELTARTESGIEVFGKKLKMYKRKGLYGRQFIIPIGRLDLLCEDDNGDLYVIELKKDSGYDDAYKQTAEYLDWFEQDEISAGKKVYGIICLNSPTKELISKVRADKRMKLYEYQISYTEI